VISGTNKINFVRQITTKLKPNSMKSISTFLFAVFLFAFSIKTYAIEGDFILTVKKRQGNEIHFILNGKQKIKISIVDAANKELFSEQAIGEKGITKTYNLDEFPEGQYYLIVSSDLKSVKHKITITQSSSQLSKNPIVEVYLNKADKKKLFTVQ
jgi:hypothetical protein